MSDWTIRPATRRDVTTLLAIEVDRFPEPWTRTMLLEEITNDENRRYTVATADGVLLGYCGAMFVEQDMHITTVGVRQDVEGRGIATGLLVEMWDAARARGMTRATLEVAVSNERALALYRRFGFAPVGVRKRYYQVTGEDALVCWADIAGDVPSLSP